MSAPEKAPAQNALRRGTVHQLSLLQRIAFWPAAWALDVYYWTLRFEISEEAKAILADDPKPSVIVAWHNRSLIFPAVMALRPPNRVNTIISASRLAAWEAAYFEHRRLPVIRGSSTRGGFITVKMAYKALLKGGDVALSPDGPSGPLYSVQAGAAAIARKAKVPVIVVGCNQPKARRLKTWDKHFVPYPFQTVRLDIRQISPEILLKAESVVMATNLINEALTDANHA